jgi:hypothetical protein
MMAFEVAVRSDPAASVQLSLAVGKKRIPFL